MASEPAVAEAEVQAEPEITQVADPEPEVVDPSGEDVSAEAVPEPSEAVEAESQTDVLDQLSEQDIERLVQSERLKTWRETERNAGAQAKESELRRQAGSDEHTMERVNQLVGNLKQNPDSKQAQQAIAQQLKANKEWAQTDILSRLPDAILKQYEIPQKAVSEALDWFHAGNMDRYVTTLMDAAISNASASEIESKARKMAEKIVADEVDAARREAGQKIKPPPAAPGGEGAGGDGRPDQFQWAAASPEQRRKWREQRIEPRIV